MPPHVGIVSRNPKKREKLQLQLQNPEYRKIVKEALDHIEATSDKSFHKYHFYFLEGHHFYGWTLRLTDSNKCIKLTHAEADRFCKIKRQYMRKRREQRHGVTVITLPAIS